MWLKIKLLAGALIVVVIVLAALMLRSADYPAPTGPQRVSRTLYHWTDSSRGEDLTPTTDDRREMTVHLWYPADPASSAIRAPYVSQLDQLQDALRSEELNAAVLFGLRFVQTHAVVDAPVAPADAPYPILLFSPGNATNAAFFSALLEEWASQGYVIAAIDHPYDVAAVALSDGRVARFAEGYWPPITGQPTDSEARLAVYRDRVGTRARDMRFVLDQLAALNAEAGGRFYQRLDLDQVASAGHSVGGVAAAQVCQLDTRLRACLNLDGLAQGAPFFTEADGAGPTQPFMFMTKPLPEPPAAWRANHAQARARLVALMRSVAGGSRQVTIAGATHQSFSDGPLLMPPLLNPDAVTADQTIYLIRQYSLSFFDTHLKPGKPSATPTSPRVTVEFFKPG